MPNGIYLIFGQNGVQRGGIYIKPAAMPGPAHWLPYASVPSADKGFALATASGARQAVAPMDVPGGSRIAVIFDPAGAAFAIHSMPAAAAAADKAPAKAKAKAKSQGQSEGAKPSGQAQGKG